MIVRSLPCNTNPEKQAACSQRFCRREFPILYVILSVLVLISVVPMYFYSAQVQSINRDRLITNERLLQNTLTQSIADDISQHQESFRPMQANLASALQVASGNDLTGETCAGAGTTRSA